MRLVGQDDIASSQTETKNDNNGKGGATNSGSVNRVSFAAPISPNSGRQLDFDISGMVELRGFTISNVCMISEKFEHDFPVFACEPMENHTTTLKQTSCYSVDFSLDFHGDCRGVDEFFVVDSKTVDVHSSTSFIRCASLMTKSIFRRVLQNNLHFSCTMLCISLEVHAC